MEFGLSLKHAQHLLGLRIDEALRPIGLSLGLWGVLREIGRTPGASASELGRTSFHTPQTVGGLLQRLESQGLVERRSGRGRIVENHLTRQGTKVLRQASAIVEQVIGNSLEHLDATNLAQASRFLTAYIAAMADNS